MHHPSIAPPPRRWRPSSAASPGFASSTTRSARTKRPASTPPASLYTASPRSYPRRLPALEYPPRFEARLVSANGAIRWRSGWVNCSHVLPGESVGFEEVADGIWALYYGPVLLGRFNDRDPVIVGAHNRNRFKRPRPGLLPMFPV